MTEEQLSKPYTVATAPGRLLATRRVRAHPSPLVGGLRPYLYIAPGFLMYVVFVLIPIAQAVFYSFTEWDGIGSRTFVGLGNYARALTGDSLVWTAVSNNLVYIIFSAVLAIAVGMALASLMARSHVRAMTAFRALLFLPQVVPIVAIGIIWGWILNPGTGALNVLLSSAGLGSLSRPWLGDLTLARYAIGGVATWVGYGFAMVIFLAAIQRIDEAYYDAVKLDGGNAIHEFLHVTLPGVRYELTLVLVVGIIVGLDAFALVFVTTDGGPSNATIPIVLYVYRLAFRLYQAGYGSAIAVLLTLLTLAVAVLVVGSRERSETLS